MRLFLSNSNDCIPYSIPSMAAFGGAAGSLLLFFTSSWKGRDVLQFVPVYRNKYEEKDPDMA